MNKIKSTVLSLLTFFGLVDDHDGRWSWTTTVLIVCLVGMCAGFLPPGFDLGAMLLALLARAHKKVMGVKAQGQNSLQETVTELKAQVESLLSKITSGHDSLSTATKALADTQEKQTVVLTEMGHSVERLQNQMNPAPGVKGFTPFGR